MRNISPIIAIAFGTLILSFIGLYNGYPLVYSDTGTYIASGLKEFVPYDRPITYGLFIKLFSFNISLWYVVFFQNLITAYVIYELLKSFELNKKYLNLIYLAILAFLVLFTGTGWYSNQIMPDFFAPLAIMIIYILLWSGSYSMVKRSILYLILIFSLVTHFSHLLMGLVIIVLIVIIKLVAKKQFESISFRRIVSISSVITASWVLIPVINYVVEGAFVFSKGNHVFLVAHLNDTGILKKFLDEKCDETEYKDCKLCNYKDSLPDNLASFIWSGHILDSTGGWTGSKDEYNKIIYGTLKEPEYLFLNIFKSVQYGLTQLTRNDIGQGLSSYGEGSPPYGQIHWEFHHELNDYLNSRQNRLNGSNLNFDNLNTFHNAILILSFILLLVIIFTPLLKNPNSATTWFLIFVIVCVIINAFITAGLNSPCTRFQARVVWLVPLAMIIFSIRNLDSLKNAGSKWR